MTIGELASETAKWLEPELGSVFTEKQMEDVTVKAAVYSLNAGGKRLRPLMMRLTALMTGCPEEKMADVLYYAATLEMIHTYSLCHDDLPAMDNDTMRRGMPSTFAKFGEAMGILAGDALLNYAFETAQKTFDAIPEDAPDAAVRMKKVAKAFSILSKKAGIYGMIAGQVADIEAEDDPSHATMDTIRFVHENKTAAMIESSMMIGAALAGATKEEIQTMETIGSDVGLAFQIVDDILDITGDKEALGKPIGSDERNGKVTYVSLVGLEKAREDVKMLSKRAQDSLAGLAQSQNAHGAFLKELITALIDRDR